MFWIYKRNNHNNHNNNHIDAFQVRNVADISLEQKYKILQRRNTQAKYWYLKSVLE